MHYQPALEERSFQSRFFAHVQAASWYRAFLLPVVASLADLASGSRVLDIGTGPGKLLTLLRQETACECVGVDADRTMLLEARRHPELADASLVHVPAGEALLFQPQTFDAVCFCSVLYLLQREEGLALLRQAQTLLRPHGRIVILTPSGAANVHAPAAWQHWTFYLWRRLTASAGRQWQALRLAADFAEQQGMAYTCHPAFSGMATIEVLTIPATSPIR